MVGANVWAPTPQHGLSCPDNFKRAEPIQHFVYFLTRWLGQVGPQMKFADIKPGRGKPTRQYSLASDSTELDAWIKCVSMDNGMLVLIENLDMKASLEHRLIVANPEFHLKWFSELMHCILT